jgi:predicted hydrocarbon binding protein
MERKHFLRTSLCLGALCGLHPVLGAEGKVETAAAPENPCAGAMAYARHWVKDLIDQADAQLSEPQRRALLEARGRSCAKAGGAQRAAPFRGRLDEYLADVQRHLGADGAKRTGDNIQVIYPRCFCPLVSDFEEPLSSTYCFCSAGWLKEVYETVSGEPVKVEILETIKRGAPRCRFEITLGA